MAASGAALLLLALMCKSSGGGSLKASGGAAGATEEGGSVGARAGSRTTGGTHGGALGDGGASSNGGLPGDQTWLDEPANWAEVAAAAFTKPACTISESRSGRLEFPALVWESCGAACQSADVVQGYGELGAFPFASTVQLDDASVALLALSLGVKVDERWLDVRRVIRADSGKTLGALKAESSTSLKTSPCSFGGPEETAVVVNIAGGDQGDPNRPSSDLDGFVSLEGGAWGWASPATLIKEGPGALLAFDVDLPEPSLFLIGGPAVYKQKATLTSEYETLENSSAYFGAGQGDLAVWNDLTTPGQPRLRGWAPDGQGVRTIVEKPPLHSCNVVVSPTALIAVTLEGDPALFRLCSGPVDSAHLWRSPRTYAAADAMVTDGPALPGAPFVLSGLKTWGDFAAMFISPVEYKGSDFDVVGESYLMLVQLSTWKMWRVNATDGHAIQSTSWTLTDNSLYFGESNPDVNEVNVIRRLVRVPLAQVDSYGMRL